MAILEVRANVAFRDWKAMELRAVDGADPYIQGLVYAGYLTVVNVFDESLLDPELVEPKKPRRKKVTDVASGDLPEGSDQSSPA